MKKVQLSELSQDELKNKAKTLKAANTILGTMLIILALASGYLTLQQGFTVFSALPVAFLPMFVINITNLKKIRNEIASRNT
ncbi:MAG: hypothetical protein Q8S11_17385 [Daejeonella sp.]|uniref:hypothetical protein n=1 Tax=Daejeonella sp. TaxID=2805397 RepID=UPI00273389E9|nr:hypothetical protein [Daejeonella sp.]MDP3470118.1 hypothetical protein [Daejeonella sp.]